MEMVGTIVRNIPKNPPSVVDFKTLDDLGLQGLIPQGWDRKVISLVSEQDY